MQNTNFSQIYSAVQCNHCDIDEADHEAVEVFISSMFSKNVANPKHYACILYI